jgi:hypothetical protein
MRWVCLLKCVLDIDLEHCPQYGNELKIIVAIEEPACQHTYPSGFHVFFLIA